MEEDKFLKIYESTQKAVEKYQDRLTPVYVKITSLILVLFALFTFFYFDISNNVESGKMSKDILVFAQIVYGIVSATLIASEAFVSYAYFVPESHILKPIVFDYEKRDIVIATNGFSTTDFDSLFFHIENKMEQKTNDDYTERYFILKEALESKVFEAIEKENVSSFKSRYLNLFIE